MAGALKNKGKSGFKVDKTEIVQRIKSVVGREVSVSVYASLNQETIVLTMLLK